MCGIAGVLHRDPQRIDKRLLTSMTDAIAHRGPDGADHFVCGNNQVGLGHRRLSIIDLSTHANQPMPSGDGRYVIIFNGEIYNYVEIKERLQRKGYVFKTASDTEVLLVSYQDQGAACLGELDGMFAFAIWDSVEQTLFMARDRFGEKPIYYSFHEGGLYFASEMKALWAAGVRKVPNQRMVFNYMAYGQMNNVENLQETFYENIFSFPHAHYAVVKPGQERLVMQPYWNIDPDNIDVSISLDAAKKRLHELMYQSVSRRLRSDVPVGSSLSGGLDSSLIVSIINDLNRNNHIQQKTFSARFPGYKKDEGRYMQLVIDRTNVEPYFVYPTDEALIKDIDTLYYHQEEPFGSASIYAQYAVMRLAKENGVIVLLDGQGADESLAGYHFYYPTFFRDLQKSGNRELYEKEWQAYQQMYAGSDFNPAHKKDAIWFIRNNMPGAIGLLKSMQQRVRQLQYGVYDKDFFSTYIGQSYAQLRPEKSLNRVLYNNMFRGNGLQILLRYADRNSMANSREVRLPYLSHELVEFIFSLPSTYKIHDAWTKWIMRATFGHILPEEITWRKDKIGYEPPQQNWMENKVIRESIQASKETLVKEHILGKKILSDTRADFATNWTYWMVGKLYR